MQTKYKVIIGVAVVLCILVIQQSAKMQDLNCTLNQGTPNFQLTMLCGKKVYATFMSGNEGNYSCVVSQFKCYDNGTITCDSIVFERGEKISIRSWLTDLGNGVVLRETPGKGGKMIQMFDVVISYSIFISGDIKVSYYICASPSSDNHHTMRAIIATNKKADLTDDVNLLNSLFPCGGLFVVPNTCDVSDFY